MMLKSLRNSANDRRRYGTATVVRIVEGGGVKERLRRLNVDTKYGCLIGTRQYP